MISVVDKHPQIRSHVETVPLEPLSIGEVHELLHRRYEHLRLDTTRPAIAPVADSVVAELHALYRGDLRGLLQALESGVKPLLGLNASGSTPQPADAASVRAMTQARYSAELERRLDKTRGRQLDLWGRQAPGDVMTQTALKTLWNLKSQGTVSLAINTLVHQGYVIALPRDGRKPVEYVLSGVSRMVYG